MSFRFALTAYMMTLGSLSACSNNPSVGLAQKKTSPVSGTVVIDGVPQPSVKVKCYRESDATDQGNRPNIAVTDVHGRFAFSTYLSGDGLPAGKYKLTFVWDGLSMSENEKGQLVKRIEDRGDRLRNAYSDPKTSRFDFIVTEGKKNELGKIELSTRGGL